MGRHIIAACGALAIAGVTLAAQTPSPSQPPSPAPSAAQAGTVTIQGCLKPASGSASTGATGTTGTTGAAPQFLLTDADIKSGSASGAAGTTGAPRTGAMDDEFVLRPDSATVNLSQHLNHQVEVVGRMASSGGTTGAPTGTTGTTGAAGAGAAAKPTLTVTSIKMLAAECK
ncbi:MAG TPA: hypothetical protein VM820_15145 [Vicinamibacterales bacterium]|nr:hypothetical protein [Vicinamibacterales bacterium]